MNPVQVKSCCCKKSYRYTLVECCGGFVLTLLLNKELDLGAVAVSIILVTVLVVNFFIFALGEVIDLLQNLKDNTSKSGNP